jgi:hypothetical protein
MSAAMAPVESNNHCTFRSAKDDFHAKEDIHIFPSLVPYCILLVSCAVLFPPGSTSLTFSDMKEGGFHGI